MIVSHSHKFIYARVPKTGSTAVASSLSRYRSLSERVRLVDLAGKVVSKILCTKRFNFSANPHLSLSSAKKIIGDNKFTNYFKFSVVRHPVDRLYSQFGHIRRHIHCPKLKAMYPEMAGNGVCFEDFVDFVCTNPIPPQASMLIDEHGSILIDNFARVEQLEEELLPILSKLNIRCIFKKLNVGEAKRLSDISDRTRSLIEEMFDVDYALFGYDRFGLSGKPKLNSGKIEGIRALGFDESLWRREKFVA